MKKRRRKKVKRWIVLFITAVMLLTISISERDESSKNKDNEPVQGVDLVKQKQKVDSVEQKLERFAEENNFSINEYPTELVELLKKNSETEQFVLNYPLKKNTFSKGKLKELELDKIPLLLQWDSRWGYYQYGDNVMGLTGCGPTCLSMVASYLLQNPELTPIYMADYATRNGYCVSGSGTSWDFMSDGAAGLGLQVQEVPLMESKIKQYLEQGYPIICIMGEGEFTDKGHFIVLTGLEDDKIRLNDPNSRKHSERLWEYEELKNQIRNIWVYQADGTEYGILAEGDCGRLTPVPFVTIIYCNTIKNN